MSWLQGHLSDEGRRQQSISAQADSSASLATFSKTDERLGSEAELQMPLHQPLHQSRFLLVQFRLEEVETTDFESTGLRDDVSSC